MDAEPVAIPGDMTIGDALHEYFLRYRYDWFPVVDDNGRFVGIVDRERAERIPEDRQAVFTVQGDPAQPRRTTCACAPTTRSRRCSAAQALMRLGALMAVDARRAPAGSRHMGPGAARAPAAAAALGTYGPLGFVPGLALCIGSAAPRRCPSMTSSS